MKKRTFRRGQLLGLFCTLAERAGRRTLLTVLAATVLLGLAIPRLRVSSSHDDLASTTHPERIRYQAFLKEFGASDNMIVVLDGAPDDVREAAPAFVTELRAATNTVKSVFHGIDRGFLIENAPLLAPTNVLQDAVDFLSQKPALVQRLAATHDLPAAVRLMADAFAGKISGLDVSPANAPRALRAVHVFFAEWNRWLEPPRPRDIDLDAFAAELDIPGFDRLRNAGTLTSRDGSLRFIFVQPAFTGERKADMIRFRDAIRAACDRAAATGSEACRRVTIAFTGIPAHRLAEVETIRSDVGRAGVVAVLLVVAILWYGFRSWRTIALALTPLLCGMVMSVGIIALTVGRLNLISSSFLAVLFGIGIDFAIYLVRRTEEELGKGSTRPAAVRIALTESGRGVLTGGVSTGLAFLAVGFCDFVGFSELGLTAGIGILVVMATTFVMLPALLIVFGIRPRAYDTHLMALTEWKRRERRFLYPVVIVGFGLAILGALAVPRLSFDFNALHLLPDDCDSTVYQLRMQDESDLQVSFAAVTAPNLETLSAMEERMRDLPTVSRIDSLTSLLPNVQPLKVNLLRQCGQLLPPTAPAAPGSGEPEFVDALEQLLEAIETAQDKAFMAGHAAIVEAAEPLLGSLEDLMDALTGPQAADALTGSRAFDAAVFENWHQATRQVTRWTQLTPLTEETLPPQLVGRFRSPAGNYVSYVFPNGSVWELEFLDRFVADLRTVTPNVTGFPVTMRVGARSAVYGLRQSLVYGFLMIVFLLFLDFRRLRAVILTLVPLTVGMLWVQGIFYLLGKDYNYASMAGMPLLLGLGVVYGVHIVHRWLEAPEYSAFAAAVTAGRGVAFAALTTMAGLVSITFGRHRGVADFGLSILLGILCCLTAALTVLPALIDLVYEKPENSREGHTP